MSDRADRQPDQDRDDEVAPGALLDALVGLFELGARVRDLVLELAARSAHLGLERRDRRSLGGAAVLRRPAASRLVSGASGGGSPCRCDRRMRRS